MKKKQLIEFLATIIAALGFLFSIALTFCIMWFAASLFIFVILAVFDISKDARVSAVLGLLFLIVFGIFKER